MWINPSCGRQLHVQLREVTCKRDWPAAAGVHNPQFILRLFTILKMSISCFFVPTPVMHMAVDYAAYRRRGRTFAVYN